MKNVILLFIIISICNQTKAQYQSIFGQNNTAWKIMFAACDYACSHTYIAENDTLIAQETYKIIRRDLQNNYVREDTALGKVWYYDSYSSSEHLLMDLNLTLGDSFQIHNLKYPVDSVYYFQNKKHIRIKRYKSACAYDSLNQLTFIEGVGCSSGFYYNTDLVDNEYLLCQIKDMTTDSIFEQLNLWDVDNCDYCAMSNRNIKESELFSVYPNPFTDKILINAPVYTISILIYNSIGQLVAEEQISEEQVETDLSNLKIGIYTLMMIIDNQLKFTKKIVKMN